MSDVKPMSEDEIEKLRDDPLGYNSLLKLTVRLARDHARLVEAVRGAEYNEGCALADCDQLRAELATISDAIGSVEYMDPPDGGSVSLAEQVRRMRAELAAIRSAAERYRRTPVDARDLPESWDALAALLAACEAEP